MKYNVLGLTNQAHFSVIKAERRKNSTWAFKKHVKNEAVTKQNFFLYSSSKPNHEFAAITKMGML